MIRYRVIPDEEKTSSKGLKPKPMTRPKGKKTVKEVEKAVRDMQARTGAYKTR